MMQLGTCCFFFSKERQLPSHGSCLKGAPSRVQTPEFHISTQTVYREVTCCTITNCPKTVAAGKNEHSQPWLLDEGLGVGQLLWIRGSQGSCTPTWRLTGGGGCPPKLMHRGWQEASVSPQRLPGQHPEPEEQLSGRNTAQLTVTPLHTCRFPSLPGAWGRRLHKGWGQEDHGLCGVATAREHIEVDFLYFKWTFIGCLVCL